MLDGKTEKNIENEFCYEIALGNLSQSWRKQWEKVEPMEK